ncbi:MAG: hypothetical protein WAW00_02345 [Candidatus Moraniibacteriota bacterium]
MTLSFYKQYAPLIILSMLLAAMAAIAWFGIRPLKQSLDGKMRGVQEFHTGRENRERQVGRLPELRGQYEAIVADEDMLDILITEEQVVDFVKTLEALAGMMNVQMSIVSKADGKIAERKKPAAAPAPEKGAAPGSVPAPDSAKQKPADILDDAPFDRYLHLSVKVEGRYGDIVAFLHKMETLPFGLDVIGIEMKKTDGQAVARPSTAGAGRNPFSIFGSNQNVTAQPQAPVRGDVEAAFDILVYVAKKTDV